MGACRPCSCSLAKSRLISHEVKNHDNGMKYDLQYPLVIKHDSRKSPCLTNINHDLSSISGYFFITVSNYPEGNHVKPVFLPLVSHSVTRTHSYRPSHNRSKCCVSWWSSHPADPWASAQWVGRTTQIKPMPVQWVLQHVPTLSLSLLSLASHHLSVKRHRW